MGTQNENVQIGRSELSKPIMLVRKVFRVSNPNINTNKTSLVLYRSIDRPICKFVHLHTYLSVCLRLSVYLSIVYVLLPTYLGDKHCYDLANKVDSPHHNTHRESNSTDLATACIRPITSIHTSHYIALHSVTLQHSAVHHITLHSITLHCIALRPFTLHVHTHTRVYTYIYIHTQ